MTATLRPITIHRPMHNLPGQPRDRTCKLHGRGHAPIILWCAARAVAAFTAARHPTGGTVPKALKVTLRVLAAIGLVAAVFGGLVILHNPDAVPMCDGREMHPGQTCVTVRPGQISATSDDRWSYERSKQSMETSLTIDKFLVGIGGAVFLGAVITLRVKASERSRE
ncbi:hypothetical protein [Streptomyces sp. x-19]|uniref:hypothetical protein n=1 Tax=Streptomyces sp. x-19 TaxID=2789280 RepID=UPI00397F5FE2